MLNEIIHRVPPESTNREILRVPSSTPERRQILSRVGSFSGFKTSRDHCAPSPRIALVDFHWGMSGMETEPPSKIHPASKLNRANNKQETSDPQQYIRGEIGWGRRTFLRSYNVYLDEHRPNPSVIAALSKSGGQIERLARYASPECGTRT